MEPWFVDVDEATWLIEPEQVLAVARKRKVGAVVVVSAFGAPLDISKWDRFTADTGIPVLIDAAAGFDSFAPARSVTTTTIIVSLHATKVSGIGEGAVVVASDPEVGHAIRNLGNFGITAAREVVAPGLNA